MMFAGTGVWKSKRGAALLGCRYVFINDEQYGYNVRDELIAADEVSYAYDDIGNRTTAEGKTYTANNLNQYTAIDDFVPQYDADGNQTLIQTSTGVWQVTYNAENRPIRWQSGDTVIEMAFDRMGRRTLYRETKGDTIVSDKRFLYRDYLCIAELDATTLVPTQSYVWDPTEPIATRPLVFSQFFDTFFYFHDGNKNVSDFISSSGIFIHYAYTPFGTHFVSATSENRYQFSSEAYDKALGLVYFNYRHYHSDIGRWQARDVLSEYSSRNLFLFVGNTPLHAFDYLGLAWGNTQAVYHYFTGKGRRVWLTETGHYDTVTANIARQRKEWHDKMIKDVKELASRLSCPCNPTASRTESDTVAASSGVFWIGGFSLFRNYECFCSVDASCEYTPSTWTCTCRAWYDMRDLFEDPLDFDNDRDEFYDTWTLGGTPFEVYSRWEDEVYTETGSL